MFDKGVKEDLLKIKSELENNFISFTCSGKKFEEKERRIIYTYDDELNGIGSNIDSYLKDVVKKLVISKVDFDRIDFGFNFGLIFSKKELGSNGTLLPSSTPYIDKACYYTSNATAYLNGEEQKTIGVLNGVSYNGFIDFDKFVKDLKKFDLSLSGPQSYRELENLIRSGETCNMVLTIDFSKELEPKTYCKTK